MSAATAAPTTTTATADSRHKPILAERFKTKMCQNFEKTGVCPYETRCMFAHGEIELRTKQMNLHDNLVTEEAIKAFQRARVIAARSAAQKKLSQQARKDKKRAMQLQQNDPKGSSESGPLPMDEAMLSSDSTLNRTGTTGDIVRANSVSSAEFKTPAALNSASREDGFPQEPNPLNVSNRSFRHDPYYGPSSPETPGRGGVSPSRMTPSRAAVSPGTMPADLAVCMDPSMVSTYCLPAPMATTMAPHAGRATSPSLAAMAAHPHTIASTLAPSRSPQMRHRDPGMTPTLFELKRYDSLPDMRETMEDTAHHFGNSSTTSQPAALMQHPMPQYAPCACRDCHVRQVNAQHQASGRATPQTHVQSGPPSQFTTPQHNGGHPYMLQQNTPMTMPHCANVPSVAAILAGHPRPVLYQPCGPGGAIMRRGSPQVTSFDVPDPLA